MTERKRACKGCGSTTRKLTHPGPRCGPCHRSVTTERRTARHTAHIADQYGLTAEEYQALYAAQGGRCAGCQLANGSSRKLSVDHRHSDGLVRMLACRVCNNYMGYVRDDPTALRRLADALENPPAVAVLGERFVPIDGAPTKRPGATPSTRSRRATRRKRSG